MTMPYKGTSLPRATVRARVIRKDGTVVNLGIVAGEGRDEPENVEIREKGRKRLADAVRGEEVSDG
jgi:hypothetical protein